MSYPTEKSSLQIRWVVLFLSSMLMIGNYYCYDNPAALHDQLENRFSSQKDYEFYFNLLYSVYSFPNIVLPFFGGYFVDKLGCRLMMVVFGGFVLLGQIVFAVGCSIKSFPVMLLGRAIFGFGGESMTVGQSALMADWFKGKELAFALGINLSIARLGSVVNNYSSPAVADDDGVSYALWLGVLICVISFICILALLPMDKRADKMLGLEGRPKPPPEKVDFSDVKTFQLSFWLLALSCLVVYGCVLPFNNIASDFLLERNYFPDGCASPKYAETPYCQGPDAGDYDCSSDAWKNSLYCTDKDHAISKAASVMSIPYFISAGISPFMGYFVDKYGSRAIVATVAPAIFVMVHILLGFTGVTPIFPLVFQGLAYSIFAAALWPSIPYTVKEHQVGTAYGTVTAIQNGGMTVFPLIVAAIKTATGGYKAVSGFFAGLGIFGVCVGVYLNTVDRKNGNLLNRVHLKADVAAEMDASEPLLLSKEKEDVESATLPKKVGSAPRLRVNSGSGVGPGSLDGRPY